MFTKKLTFCSMKTYSKIVVSLLVLSLVWLYLILNLTYFVFFQEVSFFMLKIDISTQFKIVYILGVLISLGYLRLIFLNTNNNY